MHDLTTVLTTLAACSASIVAILGGFIASKLIAINAERDEVNTRIAELDEEIDFFTEERDMLQEQLNEDDALDFIQDNIECIIDQSSLDDAYKEEKRPRLQKEVLRPYWIRAEQVFQLLCDILQNQEDEDYVENEDGVPVAAAKEITRDFEYAVCKKVCKFSKYQVSSSMHLRYSVGAPIPMSTWYSDTQEKLITADNKITYLMLQRKQQATRQKALKKPKGMKLGLVLFAFFSVANIVYPLCLSPFTTKNYQYYFQTKVIAIFLFTFGLTMIMLYLVYLLHWSNKKN